MMLDVKKIVNRGIPIVTWSKDYNVDLGIADLVAGVTIGLTLIPQVIAYASLAGLGPQYGLYSSLCGGIIYAVFGTIAELNIAPTALLSLLTFSFSQNLTFSNIHAAILLCFLSGIVELLCGILHLGFLVDFVSTPVVAAFTSAGAITIASSQVKNLLGLQFKATSFTSLWYNIFANIQNTQKWDATLGIACCVILLLMRKLKDFGTPPLDNNANDVSSNKSAQIKKALWFVSVARNAFVVISCAVIAYVLEIYDIPIFSLTPEVPQGLPSFQNPVLPTNATVSTIEMFKELGVGIVVVPFVAILSNVAIAKAFAKGKVIDASQEMIAVGLCNLVGSFFGSYPINASFSRGAVSNASGVKTPLAGLYTGCMVILSLTFLTPYFSYIPKPTLSAVIICAVIFMVEVNLTKMIWSIKKIDLIPFVITLISCLFIGIEIGILIGVGVDILFLLYEAARPRVLIEKIANSSVDYIKVTPTTSIFFPSAEYIREKILKTNDKFGVQYKFVVVDCHRINKLDFTAAKCIAAFIADFKKIDKRVIFYKPKNGVAKMLLRVTKETAKIVETENDLLDALKDRGPQLTIADNNRVNGNCSTTGSDSAKTPRGSEVASTNL